MPTLTELQAAFSAAVFQAGPAEQTLLSALEEEDATGLRRLAAYRRSIMGNLLNALEATYPVVAAIVGGPFFREAARQYVAATPSRSGDLNEYGGGFADFLAAYPHAAGLPYLPDVARLEWVVQAVYYAADAPAPDLSALATRAPADWDGLVFEVAGTCRRLDSRWPLVDIWTVNQPGYSGAMEVDFSRPARALVLRRGGRVHVETLTAGEAALFDRLAAGDTLATSLAAAATDTNFDPAAALQRLARDGLLLGTRQMTRRTA
ncbi:MAG: DUF2063 domain-containing protein [Zoogloea sp.]|nr:DUF2063 domain-containing protein [Zoogloea sp.]